VITASRHGVDLPEHSEFRGVVLKYNTLLKAKEIGIHLTLTDLNIQELNYFYEIKKLQEEENGKSSKSSDKYS
jgi:hypothetical protein